MSTPSAHATSSGVAAIHDAPAAARPSPLLIVLRWEVRRALASRATWVMAALLVVVYLLLLGFSDLQQYYTASATVLSSAGAPLQRTIEGVVTRNSPFGLAILLPITVLEFALFLPFITADGVSLDYQRRTHEILMATSLPSRAYIWGRYLAGMLIALGMACVYLLALLTLSVAFHLTQPNVYPALDLPSALLTWAVIVLPPAFLLSSLCFAFGLLLPRHSNLVKAGAVFAWFAVGLVLQAFTYGLVRNVAGFDRGIVPAWWTTYETWQPAVTDSGHLFEEQFVHRLDAIVSNPSLSNQAVQQQIDALKAQLPDFGSFTLAHLVWVAFGLAAVAAASLTFRRFRNVLV
jgi:ABC-type transport system involved in multi-copper enzyme maturation permease subunit